MQYVQYERKESIFELLTDLNLITLILKKSLFQFVTFSYLGVFTFI